MNVFRCSQGHVSTSKDCPYCAKELQQSEWLRFVLEKEEEGD